LIPPISPNNYREKANFNSQFADDILRVAFKVYESGDVTLPFVALRRRDLVLQQQKDALIKQLDQFKHSIDEERMMPKLQSVADSQLM
jgi:hypothetical protein